MAWIAGITSALKAQSAQRLGRRPVRRIVSWIVIILALTIVGVTSRTLGDPNRDEATSDEPSTTVPVTPKFLLGNYASAIYLPNDAPNVRRIDSQATIQRLTAANVNSYAYLISPGSRQAPLSSQAQWDDLDQFARVAGDAGIIVFVYLVPPTGAQEKDAYLPYKWDYLSWAKNIGKLAERRPSIRGLIIDDFGGNTQFKSELSFQFTPSYVQRMMELARRSAPWLSLMPVMYFHDITGATASLRDYRDVIDGVIFPYAGRRSLVKHQPGNTVDSSLALPQGRRVASIINCRMSNTCTQVRFPARPPSHREMDMVSKEQTVRALPNARRTVGFWTNDDNPTGIVGGYYVEMLVNGRSAAVIRINRNGWIEHSVDLTAETRDATSIEIQLRLVRQLTPTRDGLAVFLDDVRWRGFSSAPVETNSATLNTTQAVTTKDVKALSFIYMTYAAPLGVEAGVGASPQYVEQILEAVNILRQEQAVDGSLIYLLNISEGLTGPGNSASYEVVRRKYSDWSNE